MLQGAAERERRQLEHDVTIAWNVERFSRTKRLKPLGQYLAELRPKKPQTSDDVLAMFQSMAKSGVPIAIKRAKKPGRKPAQD